MATAYDVWKTARERATEKPYDEHLQAVVEQLQPFAVRDFLADFRGLNGMEEPLGCDADEAAEFLAGLDELRQPQCREDETRAAMQLQVSKTLEHMRRLNWTGDHTYGDALSDVSVMLRHVIAGQKGWPVLERFRCPSEYGSKARQNERVRCELQLPHEGKHRARNTAGGEGYMWTDEQSVNPPKNHDEPSAVQISDAQLDKLGDEVFGTESSRCKSSVEYSGTDIGVTLYCKLTEGHADAHLAPTGETWTHAFREIAANPDPINRPKPEGEFPWT